MGSGVTGKDKPDKTKKKPGRRPTACAECRRLKLRCDRNVPCEKCESRGCGSICPDGVLTPGKGNRLVLANTEELHDQIHQLCSRNRELENALRLMQENVSDQPHPLLRTDILRIPTVHHGSSSGPSSSSSKSPTASRVSPITHPPAPLEVTLDEDHNNLDAFGTLVIGQQGESNFLGRTARAEYLIHARRMSHRESKRPLPPLPRWMVESSFLEVRTIDESLVSETLSHLPSWSEAVDLCRVYSEYGKIIYLPIPHLELRDKLLAVYQAKHFNSAEHFHTLSLFFIIFAIATLFDSEAQPCSTQAHVYYHLSRTSLSFVPPYHETTLASIQTLIYMALYLDLSDSEAPESMWMYIGHAVRLGYSIGLHLNPTRWKLDNEEIQRRSRVFWQLSVIDTWSSIYVGRPPGILTTFIEQPLPDATFHSEHLMTSDENAIHSWLIHYTSLLQPSLDIILGCKQPIYSHILDIDRKIRDFNVPVSWRMPPEEDNESPSPSSSSPSRPHRDISMYRWLVLSSKEIILLNLHRPYFAQALQETPADLQHHRYLPSVVAAYRSAWRLIRGLAMTWMAVPDILARLTLPWSHALSAATIMCILVTRAPTSHLTTPALEQLDNLTSLFDFASSSCKAASGLLRSVQNIRRNAHEVIGPRYYHHHNNDDNNTFTLPQLDRLNGKTYLFDENHSSSSNPHPISRATSVTISDIAEIHSASSSSIWINSKNNSNNNNLHPTLVHDLQDFGIRSSSARTVVSPMTFHDLDNDNDDDNDRRRRPSSSHSHSPSTIPPPPPVPPPPVPSSSVIPQVMRPISPEVPKPFFLQHTTMSSSSSSSSQSQLPSQRVLLDPQMHFFHQPYHVEPPSPPLVEPRRMTMSYGSSISVGGGGSGGGFGGSGFGGGGFGGGGFGGSGFNVIPTIALDPAWHGLAEQLGF